VRFDVSNWPEIDLREVRSAFREIPMSAYPGLAAHGRDGVHRGLAGQGGLFLASDMAKLLTLGRGARVLDLGCGEGATSVFLARTYGAHVTAVDEGPSDSLPAWAAAAGVADLVTPVRADARNLPFTPGSFDAIFSMNAFFYFGTEERYPSYLFRFLRTGGELVIGSPCYRDEIDARTPREFLLEYPACLSVHSPGWWKSHFARSAEIEVLHSQLHPRGVEFWEDRVRFLLETKPTSDMSEPRRSMILAIIRMLNRDADGFVSHFMLHARKRESGLVN
jgi:SAM-dependent methyltransferase